MSEVHIIAIIYPANGKIDRLTELLREMCKNVHANEPDAHRYLMTTESEGDNPTVVMIETYKNQQVAKEHGTTQWFKDLFSTCDKEGLFAKPAQILFTKSTAGFDLGRNIM